MLLPDSLTNPVLQLRIQVRVVSPPVWRRVLIPDTATICNLQDVIQAAMGWEDCHLNKFIIWVKLCGVPREGGGSIYTRPDRLKVVDFDSRAHDGFVYEYYFNSHWLHDIRVEKQLHDSPELPSDAAYPNVAR